ncbi:hypothetical protein [Streptomyces violaceus]|uniref:Uncharacterized protein n=1 Tax=Streptomyces violaceus TaxID=1936 RepID=A0ABZ1NJC0_STRVL
MAGRAGLTGEGRKAPESPGSGATWAFRQRGEVRHQAARPGPERPPFRPPQSQGDLGLHPEEAAQAVVGPAAAVARTVTAQAQPLPAVAASPAAEAERSITEAESPTTRANPPAFGSTPPTVMISIGRPDPSLRISQPHAATGAAESDPLQAAFDAMYAAVVTYGEDYPALLREVWSVVEGRRS